MKHEISSLYSQKPVTCPYPKPDVSTSRTPILIPFGSILILSSHLRLGLPSCLLTSGFPTKTLYKPLLSPYVLHAPLNSLFYSLSPEQYLVRTTNNSALYYVIFSIPLLLRPSQPQISPTAPYSQIPSAYVPPSM